MDTTLFYIAGGALIAVALILSLIGMRSDNFPSGKFLTGGIVVVFLLVATTAVGAVALAQHEEDQRLGEANAEADTASSAETTVNQDTGNTGEVTPTDKGGASPAGGNASASSSGIDGGQVFVSTGCGSCHTIASLGADAQGTIGPALDTALTEDDQAAIKEMIVDPEKEIAKGFPGGTMPTTYGDQLSPEQLDALVNFLYEQSHSKG